MQVVGETPALGSAQRRMVTRRTRSLSFCAALVLAVLATGCSQATEPDPQTSEARLSTTLRDEAARIRAEATRLAGEPSDIRQRVIFLHEIYVDSKENHAFPEIAAHGALWGHDVLSAARLTETLGAPLLQLAELIGFESVQRTLDDFALAIEVINRQVFIDTYTNYWFTKRYGREPGASSIVDPSFLASLNLVHDAVARNEILSPEDKRAVFLTTLDKEQDDTAAHGMDEAVKHVQPSWLRAAVTKPLLSFTYFPVTTFYAFDDFSNRADRVRCATLSYDVAVTAGWKRVASSMAGYGVLPAAYFDDRAGYAARLEAALLGR